MFAAGGNVGIDSLREVVVKKCQNSIDFVTIKVGSSLLDVSDSKFWLDVGTRMSTPPQKTCYIIFATEFCFRRKEKLDAELFKQIVPLPLPPHLPVETALRLLEAEKVLLLAATEEAREEVTELQRGASDV